MASDEQRLKAIEKRLDKLDSIVDIIKKTTTGNGKALRDQVAKTLRTHNEELRRIKNKAADNAKELANLEKLVGKKKR